MVIDAPAGFERSARIREALTSGPTVPGGRDVHVCIDARPGGEASFAAAVAAVPDLRPADPDGALVPGSAIDELRAKLAALGAVGPVALVIDDLHLAGDAGVAQVGGLARDLPAGAHLVLGGVGLQGLALGERFLDGSALRLDAEDLARPGGTSVLERWPAWREAERRGQPALAVQVLRDAADRDVAEGERRLLEVLVALRPRPDGVVEAMASATGDRAAVDRLLRLPLVSWDQDHLVIHELWDEAVARPEPDLLRAAAAAGAAAALATGEVEEAGRLAVAGNADEVLRDVVRVALRTQPPRIAAYELRAWRDAGLLDAADPHSWWLDAACRASTGGGLAEALGRYEAARAAFGDRGDTEAEVSVLLAAGIVARRLDDLGTVARLIGRAAELAAAGCEAAAGPARLGAALAAQIGGDPRAALAVLEDLPHDVFEDDWAAQAAMMRGTNLLLLGRDEEAVEQLAAATSVGGPWSHAVALDLLASARWRSGDRVGAIRDLEAAEATAVASGAAGTASSARAVRAVMLAADGDPEAADLARSLASASPSDPEARRLLQVAQVFRAAADGDGPAAAAAAAGLDGPGRAVRSTMWTAALQTALVPGAADRWAAAADDHPALCPAVDAGRAGAAFLADGTPAPRRLASLLPVSWCEAAPPVVEVRLLGGAAVLLDRRPVTDRTWERARVRELCLYLALVEDSSRELTADRLWPARSSAVAARNLRVTLSYLLDVLAPDRQRGSSSDLLVDRHGVLTLATGPRLTIDVRELDRGAREVLDAVATGHGRGVLGAARRLARLPRGPLLGGAPVGPWIEPIEHRRRELLLRAVAAAGPAALRAGDADLAEMLARRGLDEDPWAESLHQLAIRACLARDDVDGARRAVRAAVAALEDLGVPPAPLTRRLGREVGLAVG